MIEIRLSERFCEKLMQSYEPDHWFIPNFKHIIFTDKFNFKYYDITIDGKRYHRETEEFITLYTKELTWMKLTA